MRLIWGGAAAPDSHNRKLYVLAIGVSDYVQRDMALAYAAKDARDFAHALEGQKGGYYSDVETRIIAERRHPRERHRRARMAGEAGDRPR